LRGVGKIHNGNAALIPGLDFDVAAGDGNEGAVVSNTVFRVALRGGELVIVGKGELVVFQAEDGVGAPLVGIVRPAARAETATPFVGENDFAAVVGEGGRVPVGIVGVVDGVETLRMDGIFDVEKNSVAGAGAGGEADGGVDRDVVALIGVRGFLLSFVKTAAIGQAVDRTGARVDK